LGSPLCSLHLVSYSIRPKHFSLSSHSFSLAIFLITVITDKWKLITIQIHGFSYILTLTYIRTQNSEWKISSTWKFTKVVFIHSYYYSENKEDNITNTINVYKLGLDFFSLHLDQPGNSSKTWYKTKTTYAHLVSCVLISTVPQ
jgi:hypothetical protein